MAMNGRRVDPYAAFRFRVEIEGLVVGGFTEVGGLEMEIDVTSVREGGVNGYEHLLAGPARYPSRLALRRSLRPEWRKSEERSQREQGRSHARFDSIVSSMRKV